MIGNFVNVQYNYMDIHISRRGYCLCSEKGRSGDYHGTAEGRQAGQRFAEKWLRICLRQPNRSAVRQNGASLALESAGD